MPGAAALSASAAARAGAGYVSLVAERHVHGVPKAVVQGGRTAEALLADDRVGAIVIGPGLGRERPSRALLDLAMACGRPLILDADALALLAEKDPAVLKSLGSPAILTPHHGEFERLFPNLTGSKLARSRGAAAQTGAVIVYKGPDTVVAAPDGRAAIAGHAPYWLATAGTGDVLAGIIASLRAAGLEAFEAACAAVWLHGRAAELAGPGMIADDLVDQLNAALRETL